MSWHGLALLLFVPPMNLLLLAIAGLALSVRLPRTGRLVAGGALALLLVLAMPCVPAVLMVALERLTPPSGATGPAAIVVLGGDATGTVSDSVEVGPLTLERLRTAARLARARGLPVLTTGGPPDGHGEALGVLMARSLAEDFDVPTRWIEDASSDTWENAARSTALLRAAGVRSVLLVTHGWHMPRAVLAFRHFGLETHAAPTSLTAMPGWRARDFLPRATAWTLSYYAVHEWIGLAWYWLRTAW